MSLVDNLPSLGVCVLPANTRFCFAKQGTIRWLEANLRVVTSFTVYFSTLIYIYDSHLI